MHRRRRERSWTSICRSQALIFTRPIASDVQFEQAINAVIEAGDVPKDVLEAFEEKNRCQTRLVFLNEQPRPLLPQGDELPASPQALRSGAAQLSRPAAAPGRIRHLLPLRAERRTLRPHARALAADERRPHLLHRGAVRGGVQGRERDVSEVFQDLRHREIRHAFLHARPDASSARNSSINPSSGSRPRRWCAASCNAAASTTSKCRTKPPSTARRSTSRSGAPSAANSPSPPTRSISPCPKRFGLTYKDRDNTEKTPLCIHRAPLGTHERFIGFLIEHYAGNFPLWLAPEQVRILPIGDEDAAPRLRPRHSRRTPRPAGPRRARRQQRPHQSQDRRTPSK